ncbi:MAG TPA: hypothetical protein VF487_06130 [Chitinophagaceae bacterium]
MPKKTHKKRNFLIGGLSYVLLFLGASEDIGGHDSDNVCGGKQRWAVKVLADPGAATIKKTPVVTTIDQLTQIDTEIPEHKFKETAPRMDIEQQVYTIKNCFITDILREDDNDYHLVIEDGKGNHMVAEIPDPECDDAANSGWVDDFIQARTLIEEDGTRFRHFRYTITGVLFRDKTHGVTGRAPNNVELHPVIKIKRQKAINPIEQ